MATFGGTDGELRALVAEARQGGATTLHLRVGAPPLLRKPGESLEPAPGYEPLEPTATARLFSFLVDPDQWDAIEERGETTARWSAGDGAAITVEIFRARDTWCFVLTSI